MSRLDSFFESVKLPAMPEVAHALIKTLNDDSAGVTQVSDVISKDPALSAKVLRLANSAAFALPRGVATVSDAVSMVGLHKVSTMALGACLNDAFPAVPGLERNEFWKSNMACAGYSQWLASGLDMDPQVAWLTGMMLRLGELLIGQTNPAALKKIEHRPRPPGARWQREKALIGFTEGQITAEMAHRWNFPMLMVQALQRSAHPLTEQAFSRLGAVLHLAGLMADNTADTPNATDAVIDTLPTNVIDALGLDPQWLRNTLPNASSFVDITTL
jgi:HD-like signal output (HDOD) protein